MQKCFAIAQADAQVTNSIIKVGSLVLAPMVEMLTASEYAKKLEEDSQLQEFDTLLRNCYADARLSGFSFEADQFGGYGLFYKGGRLLKPETTFPRTYLPGVDGFIEKIPEKCLDSFADISLFRRTDVCKFDRVMVGATRFANHSCRPNCRYSICDTGKRKIIKLEIVQAIKT